MDVVKLMLAVTWRFAPSTAEDCNSDHVVTAVDVAIGSSATAFTVALVVTLAVALVVALAVALAVTLVALVALIVFVEFALAVALAVTLVALVALVVFVEFARSVRRRSRAVVFAVLFGSLRVVITSFGGLGVGTRPAEHCANRTKDKSAVCMLCSRGARRARYAPNPLRALGATRPIYFGSLTKLGKQKEPTPASLSAVNF